MIKLGLRARDIDGVVEEILDVVQRNINRRIFHFNGWDGYGASALLSYMARVLPTMKDPPVGSCFCRVIYLDCSMWKSRRVMQRKIAEALKLDRKIMAMFDVQDEEDDINGVDHGSRDVIQDIAAVIDRTLRDSRFMVIFINGTDDEIVLSPFGIPEYHDCVIIWTSTRFDFKFYYSRYDLPKNWPIKHTIRYTSVLLHSLWHLSDLASPQLSALLLEKAATLGFLQDMDLTMAIDGFNYSLFISDALDSIQRYLQGVQDPSSYWICEGVIQEDKAREINNAWYQVIDTHSARDVRAIASNLSSRKRTPYLIGTYDDLVHACGERPYRWIAITLKDEITSKNKKMQEDMQTTLAMASSLILGSEKMTSPCALLDVLFKQCNNIRVLILSCCSFSFASPPFLHCHTIRLLELSNCTDDNTTLPEGEGNAIHPKQKWECLHSLQALHLYYTAWGEILCEEKLCVMANLEELNIEGVWCWQCVWELEKRLPNLKRLRIIKPKLEADLSTDIGNSLIEQTNLEVLDLSGNKSMKKLPTSLSKASRLQELVLNGCTGLETVVLANSSLKSFSLTSIDYSSRWLMASKISLKGCRQLDKLMLSEKIYSVVELDLSGCAIKVLDLPRLLRPKRLFLLGCEHLCAIRKGVMEVGLICIDTRPGRVDWPSIALEPHGSSWMHIHAIFTDARLARSLLALKSQSKNNSYLYINITSTAYGWPLQPEEPRKELIEYKDQQYCIVQDLYCDAFKELGDDPPISSQAFPQPPSIQLDRHIEIGAGSRNLQSEVEATDGSKLGDLMTWHAESLHVHDVMARAVMPAGNWHCLRWFRVERCPNLDVIFPSGAKEDNKLETIWASDLLKARCIWSKGREGIWHQGPSRYFASLRHLQLRSCHSLQYALPLWFASFPCLETLHIIHCGSLRHMFEQDEENLSSIELPKLTTIHLHDLPALRQICEDAMTLAPALETIKIRGCWSLRRLPALKGREPGMKKPAVEVEKDVWDALEWDGVDAGHHSSLYGAPVHSRYYKKRFIRRTVLR